MVIQADVRLVSRLSLHLSYRWQDRVGSYEDYLDGKPTGSLLPYQPYSLMDGKLSWDGGCWTFYLQADNLLDAAYFDHGNIPQPGRWIKAGTIFRL